MKKLIPLFVALLIAAPAMAADEASHQAQCVAQATQQGLKGEEASDYVADCMENSQDSAASQEDAAKENQ